jgi:hypothetical protein
MRLTVFCRTCEKTFVVAVDTAAYDAWKAGALIQKVMPELSADDRELLISQICGKCFDAMFGGDPSED